MNNEQRAADTAENALIVGPPQRPTENLGTGVLHKHAVFSLCHMGRSQNSDLRMQTWGGSAQL